MSRKTENRTDTEKMAKKLIAFLEKNSDEIAYIRLLRTKTKVLMKTGAGQPQVDAILWILENTNRDNFISRINAIRLLGAIAEHSPNLDFNNVLPKIIELAREGYSLEKELAIGTLSDIATVLPECDLSAAVPVLIESLEDGGPYTLSAARAMSEIQKARPEYDCSPAFPILLKMLENIEDCRLNMCILANALEAFEPRSHEDLKLVKKAGETLKRRVGEELEGILSEEELKGMAHQESAHLSRLYSLWSKVLNERAEKLVLDKKFPAPKKGGPEGFERVHRVRRLMHPGRA